MNIVFYKITNIFHKRKEEMSYKYFISSSFAVYSYNNNQSCVCFTVSVEFNAHHCFFSLFGFSLPFLLLYSHSKFTGFAVGYIQTARSIRWARQWGTFLLRSVCWFDTFARFKELHFMVSSIRRWHGAKYWDPRTNQTVRKCWFVCTFEI